MKLCCHFQYVRISVVHLSSTGILNILATHFLRGNNLLIFAFSYISVFIDDRLGFTQRALTGMWSKYEIYIKCDPRG